MELSETEGQRPQLFDSMKAERCRWEPLIETEDGLEKQFAERSMTRKLKVRRPQCR